MLLGLNWYLDFLGVPSFPTGLIPRTMRYLGSVQNLGFHSDVLGFPIGLSPRTMQYLGSV